MVTAVPSKVTVSGCGVSPGPLIVWSMGTSIRKLTLSVKATRIMARISPTSCTHETGCNTLR